jgi:hypothetical protein
VLAFIYQIFILLLLRYVTQNFIVKVEYSQAEHTSNSVALVRERTIPTVLPLLVGEVSVNFCGQRVTRGLRNGPPTAVFSDF